MTGSPSKRAPPDGAVPRRRIVLRGDDEDVVAARQLPAQLVRVDLRAGLMSRQKIMDGMQEAEASHGTPPPFDSRTSCSLRLMQSPAPGVDGEIVRASWHICSARG